MLMTILTPTALVAALLCFGLAAGSSPNTIRGRRLQQVTQSQLAENNSPASCWLQVDSTAYDVTSCANFHPGGSGAIHDQCGKDITSIYASSSQFHTPAALAAATKLGTVVPDPVATPAPTTAPLTEAPVPATATPTTQKPTPAPLADATIPPTLAPVSTPAPVGKQPGPTVVPIPNTPVPSTAAPVVAVPDTAAPTTPEPSTESPTTMGPTQDSSSQPSTTGPSATPTKRFSSAPSITSSSSPSVVPSSSPTRVASQSPSVVASNMPSDDGVCQDHLHTRFWVESTNKNEPCIWLKARPEEQPELCRPSHPSNAFNICQETCRACSDSCENNASFKFVDSDGSSLRPCSWLALRPTKQDIHCLDPEVANGCMETCHNCPTQPPTSAPCDDDLTATFATNDHGQETQNCTWLATRSDAEQQELCDPASMVGAYFVCRESCNACTDSCDDSINETFLYNGTAQTCEWLALNPKVQPEVCYHWNDAWTVCKDTCNHPSCGL